jgi:hypothetical protein
VHLDRVRNVIRKCLHNRTCALRLTMHTNIPWGEYCILNPQPVFQEVYVVAPYHIFEHSIVPLHLPLVPTWPSAPYVYKRNSRMFMSELPPPKRQRKE